MEKRRFERIPVSLEAEIAVGGESYTGTIENVSVCGICIRTAPPKDVFTLVPETILELKFKPLSGEEINLQCEIKWVLINKIPAHGFSYRMGMEIMEPPVKYKEFFLFLQ